MEGTRKEMAELDRCRRMETVTQILAKWHTAWKAESERERIGRLHEERKDVHSRMRTWPSLVFASSRGIGVAYPSWNLMLLASIQTYDYPRTCTLGET